MTEQEKEVYSFPVNETSEVRFRVKEYREKWYLDIRLYAEAEGGKYRYPTKKGIMVRATSLAELGNGVRVAAEALESYAGAEEAVEA